MKFIFNTSFVILSFNLDFLLYKNGTSHWYNRDRIEGRPLKLVYNDPPNLSNDELLEKVKSKWNYFWHKSDSFRFVQKSCNFRNKCILHGKKTNRERVSWLWDCFFPNSQKLGTYSKFSERGNAPSSIQKHLQKLRQLSHAPANSVRSRQENADTFKRLQF